MYPRMQWIVRDGCGFRNYKPHPAPMTLFIVGELGALGFRTGFRKADLHHKSIAAAFFGCIRTNPHLMVSISLLSPQLFCQQQEDTCDGSHEQKSGSDGSGCQQCFPGCFRESVVRMFQDSQHTVVGAGTWNEADDAWDYEHGGCFLESSGEDIAEEPHKAGGYECRQYW